MRSPRMVRTSSSTSTAISTDAAPVFSVRIFAANSASAGSSVAN